MSLVQFTNGINMMIDCRRAGDRPSPLQYLRQRIQKLDIVVVTHPHQDHLTCLEEVCDFYKPKHLWHCGRYFKPDPVFDDWVFYERLIKGDVSYSTPMTVHSGQIIKIGDSQITVLAPRLPFLDGTVDDV